MRRKIIAVLIVSISILNWQWIFGSNNDKKQITVLHTNDIHGSFVPRKVKPQKTSKTRKELGGVLALNYFVNQIRSQEENVLLLDAGDFMTGNPICEIEYQGALGGAMVEFFNLIKYDGLTPGNHEFDISLDNIGNLIKIAKFPIFSANLFTTDGKLFTENGYHIYHKNGLAVGVIGVILDDLQEFINAPQKNQILVKPSIEVVDSLAKAIDRQTDLIIILSHCGIEHDKRIAEKTGDEIDVIIGGHSHTTLKKAKMVNGKIIVQTGSHCRNLGRLDLVVENDKVAHFDYKLIPLWNENITPDPEIAEKVAYFQKEIDKEYGKVIGKLLKPWYRSHNNESNIGDFIADVIREYANADIAGINSGGIRQNLSAGPIRKLDIKNILPFNNTVTTFITSGNDILKFVELNARASAYRLHGILQISGLKYEYQKTDNNQVKILKVMVNGKPLDPQGSYKFATVDFVVSNADKYLGFQPKEVKNLMMPLSELVMKTIEERKEVSSKVEGRILKK